MAVDKAELSESQARSLAQKRQAVETEENQLTIEAARVQRAKLKEAAAEKQKSDAQMVEISKSAERQVEALKKVNQERVHNLNKTNEEAYVNIAATTAEKIKALEDQATKSIADRTASSMERLKSVTDQTEDPFYRVKSLNPVMGENDKEYTIKVSLPPYEAQNVFASGEGDKVKISLNRRFQDKVENKETLNGTRTNSFQTIVEYLEIPGAYETKKISKEYADGVLTVHVPKKINQLKV